MLPNRKASEIATGRWAGILMHFGVDESFLKNKHGPCPICNGKDRFRWDNKEGRGGFICNQCGSGDGFKLLELLKGWTFREAAYQVEQIAGAVRQVESIQESDEAKKCAAVKRIWSESETVAKDDPVWLYLNRRIGIELIPACLRYHPALPYVEDDDVTYHPAMIAAVVSVEGFGIGIHRIYLDMEGNKANVKTPKKLMAGKKLNGGAVRLAAPIDGVIGIAEGIETALAASRKFGIPTWATISSGLMEGWSPPESINKVVVFGDNDASYTGQAAAFHVAKRMKVKGIDAEVHITPVVGTDWADEGAVQ